MSYSKDPSLLRSIIMHHYEKPSQKVENINDIDFQNSYQNKSSTCIDDITVYIDVQDNLIKNIYFSGLGCAISTASTNIMSTYLVDKTIEEANLIIDNYIDMTLGKEYNEDMLGELIALYNVNNQSNRIKCAQIGINAIKECLKKF
ncbi:MAG: SUF system NifU family Fe-S cluster assembly protein [Candidatus Ureaplasma intestinipullorum]|uniref:SUF system NifU family Fe-S cluster assembly protein n=1 Tax=Candidatus Ureaplasma intestinipullorum TaxID=2838770 RepID=A0A9E2KXH2_9BACT|nr:SUF system NifU family Fe-S cluster assembly protein [Candidatus Ureaplasma intestinipullorum]